MTWHLFCLAPRKQAWQRDILVIRPQTILNWAKKEPGGAEGGWGQEHWPVSAPLFILEFSMAVCPLLTHS